MNVYDQLLATIIDKGSWNESKKGKSIQLIGQTMVMDWQEITDILKRREVPRRLLTRELHLYLNGETRISKYEEAGIKWWSEYGTDRLVNTYPDYMKDLEDLIDKINREKRGSRNYVLLLGNSEASTQKPCISMIQFQVAHQRLVMSVYQRSCDASLGLPCDIFQMRLLADMIELPLEKIIWHFGNVHIYENNLEETGKYLAGEEYNYTLNI